MLFLDVPPLIYFKTAFLRNRQYPILTCTVTEGNYMLTKRSTGVDQNFLSKSIHFQLSVAIFMTPRTHLGPQECAIREKSPKNTKSIPTRCHGQLIARYIAQ